jgi:hypothetical protein
MIVGEHMQTNFVTLSSDLGLTAAASQVSTTNYGVVVNASLTPIALVTQADLMLAAHSDVGTLQSATHLPRVIITGHNMEMNLFARSSAVLTRDLGSHGAVVMARTGVAGVLPLGKVINFMEASRPAFASVLASLSAPSEGPIELSSGMTIAGTSTEATTGLALVACATCGYINSLYFVPSNPAKMPKCQNPAPPPHVLKVGRSG